MTGPDSRPTYPQHIIYEVVPVGDFTFHHGPEPVCFYPRHNRATYIRDGVHHGTCYTVGRLVQDVMNGRVTVRRIQ